jgi:hypothetical protein
MPASIPMVEIDHVVDLSSLAEGAQENTTGESQNQESSYEKNAPVAYCSRNEATKVCMWSKCCK